VANVGETGVVDATEQRDTPEPQNRHSRDEQALGRGRVIISVMSLHEHVLILRFPTVLRYVFLPAALIGCAAILQYGVPVYTQDAPAPPGWAFALMLLGPIGGGFLLMTFQTVFVSEDSIESRFLGFRKRLDARSARLSKIRSNGFLLVDAEGNKLFINHFMIGSDTLYWLMRNRST